MRSRPRARRRARYAAVEPGYHANKRHWNSVHLDRSIEDVELQEMIDHSYTLIVNRLPGAGWLVWLALGVYLCAALARLLRSCRNYARRSPVGYMGLPMPACGWLLSAAALSLGDHGWLPLATLGISGLAVSRRLYPSPGWMWSKARGPMLGVLAAAALAALAAGPAGLLIASAAYAIYPLVWPITDAPRS